MSLAGFVAALVIIGGLFLVGWFIGGKYLRMRGKRVVTCPENQQAAAVEVDAGKAALGGGLHLQSCTRWPEREGCGQACLTEIEKSPEGCLVRAILTDWFKEKQCALCAKPLGAIDWTQHKPGLMTAERKMLEWPEIPAEKVREYLASSKPVCWDCHIAETFRAQHPNLVVNREATGRPY